MADETRGSKDISIQLVGGIGNEMASSFVGLIELAHRMDTERVTLWLSSQGGYMSAAYTVIDVVRCLQAGGVKLRCIVIGHASAEAAWLMLACDEREMSRYGRLSFGGLTPSKATSEEDEPRTGFGASQQPRIPAWQQWRIGFYEGVTKEISERAGVRWSQTQEWELWGPLGREHPDRQPIDLDAKAAFEIGVLTKVLEVP